MLKMQRVCLSNKNQRKIGLTLAVKKTKLMTTDRTDKTISLRIDKEDIEVVDTSAI